MQDSPVKHPLFTIGRQVLPLLSFNSLATIALVSRDLLELTNSDALWIPMIKEHVISLTKINSLISTSALDLYLQARQQRKKVNSFGCLTPSFYKYVYWALLQLNGCLGTYFFVKSSPEYVPLQFHDTIQSSYRDEDLQMLTTLRKKILSCFPVLALAGLSRLSNKLQYNGAKYNFPSIHFALECNFSNSCVRVAMLNTALISVSPIKLHSRAVNVLDYHIGETIEDDMHFDFQCNKLDNQSLEAFIQGYEPLLKKMLSSAPLVVPPYFYQGFRYVSRLLLRHINNLFLFFSKYQKPGYATSFPASWKNFISVLDSYDLDAELELHVAKATKALLDGKSWESVAAPVRREIRKHLDGLGSHKITRESHTIEVAIMRCTRRTINNLLGSILDCYRLQNRSVWAAMERVASKEKTMEEGFEIWHEGNAKDAVPTVFHMAMCSRGRNNWPSPFFDTGVSPFPPSSLVILRSRALCAADAAKKSLLTTDPLDCPWPQWPLGAKSMASYLMPHVAKWAGLQSLIAAKNFGIILPSLIGNENTVESIAMKKLSSIQQEVQQILQVFSSFM